MSANPDGSSVPSPQAVHHLRIEHIDGLRAIAVLSVLCAHLAANAPNVSGAASHAMLEGAHGVDLFFVLSGFCLAFPTLIAWRRNGVAPFSLSNFATKRLVRIVPPFYLATAAFVVVAIGARLLGHGDGFPLPSLQHLVQSLLFLDGHVELINSSFWTLMVEFRWYFLFPLLLAVWVRSPRLFGVIAVGCSIAYAFTRARGLDLGTLPGFMLGIVAADIYVGGRLHPNISRQIKRYALPLAVCSVIVGVAVESNAMIPGFEGADVAWPYQPTIVGWQLATFFFVIAAGASRIMRTVLSWKPLVMCGVASYSIYLVHEPLIAFSFGHLGGATGIVCAAGLAMSAGFAFWWFAERPFTDGALRRPLLEHVGRVVDRLFAWVRCPVVVRIESEADEVPARTLLSSEAS